MHAHKRDSNTAHSSQPYMHLTLRYFVRCSIRSNNKFAFDLFLLRRFAIYVVASAHSQPIAVLVKWDFKQNGNACECIRCSVSRIENAEHQMKTCTHEMHNTPRMPRKTQIDQKMWAEWTGVEIMPVFSGPAKWAVDEFVSESDLTFTSPFYFWHMWLVLESSKWGDGKHFESHKPQAIN